MDFSTGLLASYSQPTKKCAIQPPQKRYWKNIDHVIYFAQLPAEISRLIHEFKRGQERAEAFYVNGLLLYTNT